MDLISVIIPAYNIENYLEACVKSVVGQTYTNMEIILVNDGSTDQTGEICKQLVKTDNRIQLIEQRNQGLSAARNAGIEVANGEYLTFIDGDDCVTKDYLQLMYDGIQKHDATAAVIDYAVVFEHKKQKITKSHLAKDEGVCSGADVLHRLVMENNNTYVRAWGKLFHKELWKMIRFPVGKIHEDEFTLYQIWDICSKVAVINSPAYLYIQRGDSIINTGFKITRLHKIEAFAQRNTFFHERNMTELEICSKKQYLMQLQAGYCNVTRYFPEKKELAATLKSEANKEGKEQKRILKKTCSLTEYVMIKMFFWMLPLYRILYFFYDGYCKER